MDMKRFCQDESRFLCSGGISTATSVPISQCCTNQTSPNNGDVKQLWGLEEQQQGGGAVASRNESCEMKTLAEFLRLS